VSGRRYFVDTAFVQALYNQADAMQWGLTDCISFVVMRDQNLTDALTADRHFTQAGFVPLMLGKPSNP
jgi:predicted nucleic acid-binding protein